MSDLLETIEHATGDAPTAAVIWLHGLGADGNDFVPIVRELSLPAEPAVRFVFPHAPMRAVTLNAGMRMRAWFDLYGLTRDAPPDSAGIRASVAAVAKLVEREIGRGVPAENIVVAGFSQGGAIALHTALSFPETLAGVIGLSTFLPLAERLESGATEANAATPLFLAHGEFDPMVNPTLGKEIRDLLHERGYPVSWHTYPMAHAVCPQEIADIAVFLRRVLSPPPAS